MNTNGLTEQATNYQYETNVIDGYALPTFVTPSAYSLSRTFPVKDGDVCVTSYPKSGSIWTSYTVFLIQNQGEIPEKGDLYDYIYFLSNANKRRFTLDEVNQLPTPRLFRCHMPYHMSLGGMPHTNNCKYVYVARNPKDVVVSYFYFVREWFDYKGSWEEWLSIFTNKRAYWGDWFENVATWWAHRSLDNVLWVWYEDLKTDYDTELRRIADFLGYPMSDELAANIKHKTSFQAMKTDSFTNMSQYKSNNNFFRKGTIGDSKEQLTAMQLLQFEAWCKQQIEAVGLQNEAAFLERIDLVENK